jgi:hypothetical protein
VVQAEKSPAIGGGPRYYPILQVGLRVAGVGRGLSNSVIYFLVLQVQENTPFIPNVYLFNFYINFLSFILLKKLKL